jgi:hypothetical protein
MFSARHRTLVYGARRLAKESDEACQSLSAAWLFPAAAAVTAAVVEVHRALDAGETAGAEDASGDARVCAALTTTPAEASKLHMSLDSGAADLLQGASAAAA